MSTKEKLLELLAQARGQSLSGEEIAKALGLSRAAVWKAALALRQEGYALEAAPRRGYALLPGSGPLRLEALLPHLSAEAKRAEIQLFQSLESTNQALKALALQEAPHGTALLAEEQTKGRGRFGRAFHSPKGTGLYLSILLRGDLLKGKIPSAFTLCAAVAACAAVEEVCSLRPQIKWVNDLMLNGRKVCGILSEAAQSLEGGGLDWLVVGLGLNVSTRAFPPEIEALAGSLYEDASPPEDLRPRLAAALLNRLLSPQTWAFGPETRAEYEKRMLFLGERALVRLGEERFQARIEGVDELGRLLVEKEGGGGLALASSEARIEAPG
ncbi:MAG: biotin--[acetyl-CoA-carboxylase] ligase [Christensenellaceae bacterium]|jgi:BirA family biotin operon repressor/biotin-[acetyl-CoA-carboxylase] ligase|nr:biotin--[acetyl-CoA-carboxylase] ligase [Christensenellaceae bacterium]